MKLIPRVIKTEQDYNAAIARIEEIFAASPGTPNGDELELLVMLVERYEAEHFPIDAPDPVAAIRFRMEQMDLKQKDLVPFIGSQSKVSEVLSGRRPLSLAMIRNLNSGLGIPSDVLIGSAPSQEQAALSEATPVWADLKFPFNEMYKRVWFEGFHGSLREAKAQRDELLTAFMAPMGAISATWNCALNRQHVRSESKMDECALTAWRVRVVTLAQRESLPAFKRETVTPPFLKELVHLSYFEEGPKLAREFLGKSGIALVIEPHLPRTFLDGAALKLPSGAPMVALTLRHDRLDNFWFTLCHELSHIALHLDCDDVDAFFDDLTDESSDKCEKEADEMTNEALISEQQWREADLESSPTPLAVCALAESLRISPALPAGRLRHHLKNYRILQDLIGNGKVRRLFASAESSR